MKAQLLAAIGPALRAVVATLGAATVLALTAATSLGNAGGLFQLSAGETAGSALTGTNTIEVRIIESTAVLSGPEQKLILKAEVGNVGQQAVTGDINLRVASDPFANRAGLIEWELQEAVDPHAEAWTVSAFGHQRIEAGETRQFSFEVTARQMNLGARGAEPGWGPRGILVDLETAKGRVATAATFVVYAPQEAVSTTVSLSVLGQLVAAPGEERTAAQTRLAKVTEATAEPWISWLLDPSLLSVQGQAQAHSELVQAIQQAVAAGKAVYGLPYQDIDQAALAGQIGGPEALTVSKTLSQNAAAEALGQTASSELIWDLAAVLQPIDQQIASFIGSAGSRAVVLEAGQAASALSQLNLPAAVLKGQTGPALVVTDSELTELLAGPCTALDLNRILALTAFAAWQAQVTGTAASIVIVLPRTWEPIDGEIASLEALKSAVWVEPSELNGLLDNPVSAAVEWNYPLSWPGPDRTSLAKLLDQIARAAAFASLTPDPDAYLARVTPPLLAPLSNSIEAGAARDAAGREAVRQTASEVPPVSVVVGSDVNLISDDGRIPVVVENTSNEPIAGLVISLVPQTNAVRAEEKVVLDLQPGESATARLPVHALANGLYEVKVELLDAKNRPVAEGATLTMRVRAEWEDVGTAIAAGALGIVLVVGIVSTARKRRRLRTAEKQPEAETFDVTTVEAEALDAGTSEAAASGSTVPDATPPGSTVPDSTPRDAAAGRNG